MTNSDPLVHPSEGAQIRCDFCDQIVESVGRVALDGEYERLRTPHAEQYACAACFEKKDLARRAAGSAAR
jgi:hypothetical protein